MMIKAESASHHTDDNGMGLKAHDSEKFAMRESLRVTPSGKIPDMSSVVVRVSKTR